MTPKQLSAWVAAIAPILGLIGWQGYEQVGMVKDQYITHEQAAANHLALSIQQVKVELKYMDGRDLNPKEMIYFEQMVKLLADLEAEHGRALGIRISP